MERDDDGGERGGNQVFIFLETQQEGKSHESDERKMFNFFWTIFLSRRLSLFFLKSLKLTKS